MTIEGVDRFNYKVSPLKICNFKRLARFGLGLFLAIFAQNAVALQVFWGSAQKPLPFDANHKKMTLSENKVQWTGYSLSEIVEKASQSLTPAEKSGIDLVVLVNDQGKEVFLPRAFLVKYPRIILSTRVVLPKQTQPKILKEGLQLELLELEGVSKVLLTSYQERFGFFKLIKRTDPAAVRGERLFLQNCVFCHSKEKSLTLTEEQLTASVSKTSHPVFLISKLEKKEIRSISRYLSDFLKQSTKDE